MGGLRQKAIAIPTAIATRQINKDRSKSSQAARFIFGQLEHDPRRTIRLSLFIMDSELSFGLELGG